MRNRKAAWISVGVVAAGSAFFLLRDREAPAGVPTASMPTGPPPALPPGFPPVFPDATPAGVRAGAVQGGWQRAFSFTTRAKAAEVIAYYRRALVAAGFQVMAEGGGTYGGMLRSQHPEQKRMVYVDVDAPEEAPSQVPKITVTVVDSQ